MRALAFSATTLLALGLLAAACQSAVDPPGGGAAAGGAAADAGVQPDEREVDHGGGDDEVPPTLPTTLPADCRMRFRWDAAPANTCSLETAACIARARNATAASTCVANDASCGGCMRDVTLGCLVGTAGKPGPCAAPAGCVDGCVAATCGEQATAGCREKALTSACKSVAAELQACLDKADQRTCADRARRQCVPSVACGNGVQEPGETCDGNCPTSCAQPTDDACRTSALSGSAATCSAECVTQYICPNGCPTNLGATSTAVGTIASGTALPTTTRVDWPTLADMQAVGCPSTLSTKSHVVAWKAPAAGRYVFRGTCSVIWEQTTIGTGAKTTFALDCVRRVAVTDGGQCAPGAKPTACSLDFDNAYQQSRRPDVAALAPVPLAAGDERLVAVDFGLANPLPPASGTYYYGGRVVSTTWSVTASVCTPQCSGKTCGDDGCGGSCGTCATGDICTSAGQCYTPPPPCVPSCTGRACGNDGCGGSCGDCSSGLVCSGAGQCEPPCVRQCSGKTCGDDGCGGSCGTCSSSQYCNSASQCVLSGACDPVTNVGCASPNQCITLANQTNQCVLMGTGGQGDSCASSTDCRGGHGCFAGTCRKICDRATGRGCSGGDTCAAVSGWFKYGTCAP